MANTSNAVSKSSVSKWFASKSLKLSFNRRQTKPNSSSSPSSPSSLSSPNSPITSPDLQTPKNDTLVTKREDELRQVFRRFDQNDDGKISALELRSYFWSMGEYMSHEQAMTVIGDFDADGDDLLDFEEFLKLMKRDDGAEDRRSLEDYGDDLKSAFEMFELENGCITARSVQRLLGRLGDTRSYDECKAMVRAFDKDGNGVLDFNEFHQMMTA